MIAATPKHRPLERLEIRRVERPPGLARERVEPNAVQTDAECDAHSVPGPSLHHRGPHQRRGEGCHTIGCRGHEHWPVSPARDRPASRFGLGGSSSIAFSTAGWPNAGSSGTSPRCCASLASRNRGCRRASALPGRDEKGLGVAAKPCLIDLTPLGLQLFGGGPSELLMSR